jgi:carbamoyltransferase
MKVLGLNLGVTRTGKKLKDGGACIIEDGRITVAIAEERVCRRKFAGGFKYALKYCLDASGLELEEFDTIVVSSCCEDVFPRAVDGLPFQDVSRVHFVPSHHLSHAYSAFCVSPFDRALIVVMDGGGNVIGNQKHLDWWRNPREQNSYYIGEGTSIRLIGRDFDEPFEVGFGEAYRCFTYYLGWPSSSYSGKTMALAAYGDPDRFSSLSLFEFENGRLRCKLANDPLHPIAMLERFAKECGDDLRKPRLQNEEIDQQHEDLARFIQVQLEEALVAKINYLCRETGIRDLCIAGGVGLNCLANTRILRDTPVQNLFVQPAAGDQGQALGNALYGYHHIFGKPRGLVMTNAYLGRDYSTDIHNLDFEMFAADEFKCVRSANIVQDAARLIADGYIVAWFQGRSEYGPRALGNRSILADPRRAGSKRLLDEKVKHREQFRPYAPSVLEEHASQFFDVKVDSPFMLLVATVKPNNRALIPAVAHVDGTARLQTVSQRDAPRFYELIDTYKRLTGVPVLLNTSFNGREEPIVETPEDAIRCFKENGIDALIIGDYLFTKRHLNSVEVRKRSYE